MHQSGVECANVVMVLAGKSPPALSGLQKMTILIALQRGDATPRKHCTANPRSKERPFPRSTESSGHARTSAPLGTTYTTAPEDGPT